MKVTKAKPVPKAPALAKAKPVVKTEYKGVDDTAFFIHHNKTHRSASEAFRDADYASAFWKEQSEWDDFILFCSDGKYLFPLLVVFIGAIFYVVKQY
jgi:hypothetical protein